MAKNTGSTEKYYWNTDQRGEASRPFRLWDAKNKVNVRWRCYGTERNAHTGALTEIWWYGKIGDSLEVYDARSGAALGTYTKRIAGVGFLGPKDLQSKLVKK